MTADPLDDLAPEDRKIATLARATRARTGSAEGAAVRDLDGRTYTASRVDLPSLRLAALPLAVAMAVSSGALGLEAAALCADDAAGDDALAVVRDLAGVGVAVLQVDRSGDVVAVART